VAILTIGNTPFLPIYVISIFNQTEPQMGGYTIESGWSSHLMYK